MGNNVVIFGGFIQREFNLVEADTAPPAEEVRQQFIAILTVQF